MGCFSCFKPSPSEDPFEVETAIVKEVSWYEAHIQEAERLALVIQEAEQLDWAIQESEQQQQEEEENDEQLPPPPPPPPLKEHNNISSRAPLDEDDEERIIRDSSKETKPSEDEVIPPRSMCGGCHFETEQGGSVDVLGVPWHPECFSCGACHNPISIENHVSNSRGKFHKACYERYCYVCKEKKMKNYHKHPFWEERYCPAHETDGTHKCFSCERLEVSLHEMRQGRKLLGMSCWLFFFYFWQPRGTNFVMLDDGRWLCLECMSSAVMDTDEVQPLHFEIREFFHDLNMKVEKEFPLLLVEKQALNKAEEEEKIDNQHGVVTRGICLSEEQIVTNVSKGPKMGPNKQLIGLTTESQRVVSEFEVTAILILYGLPRLLTGYILAHEMMHAYLRLNGYRNLNNVLEEGICQVLGHMWLESQTYATIDAAAASYSSSSQPPGGANASKKGEWSEFEKKLVEFCKNEIETDESAVYGEGFRKVNHMVTNSNLYETLQEILRRRG